MSCGDELYEKQWLVHDNNGTKEQALSVLGDPVVVNREYVMREGQRVYTGCDFPDELNPGVVPLGDVGTNCTDDREGCCCGFIPAMHADGTTPTTLTIGGLVVSGHGPPFTGPVISEDPEVDNRHEDQCFDCYNMDMSWSLNLVHYQRIPNGERYIYSTVSTCKPYPLFQKCDVVQGTAWAGAATSACSLPTPTVQEMIDGAAWLKPISHNYLIEPDVQLFDFSEGYPWNQLPEFPIGCPETSVYCTDFDKDFNPINNPAGGQWITKNTYPRKQSAATITLEVFPPTGDEQTGPVGGSVRVRYMAKSWALVNLFMDDSLYYKPGTEEPAGLFMQGGGVFGAASPPPDGFPTTGVPTCAGFLTNFTDLGGLVYRMGESVPPAWYGDQDNWGVLAADWEWDDVRCSWRLKAGWSKKIIDDAGGNSIFDCPSPNASFKPGADPSCFGAYTVPVEGQKRCTYDTYYLPVDNNANPTEWGHTRRSELVSPARPPIERHYAIPFYSLKHNQSASDMGAGHIGNWSCLYGNFTVSL